MKEIILSKMYLKKLFNFFFYRNKKIMTSLIYMITLFLVTFAFGNESFRNSFPIKKRSKLEP